MLTFDEKKFAAEMRYFETICNAIGDLAEAAFWRGEKKYEKAKTCYSKYKMNLALARAIKPV